MLKIIFDPTKDAANIKKHGLSLTEAGSLEWDTALTWLDERKDYGEHRFSALVLMQDRLYFVAFVDRRDGRRIISLRKANQKEALKYAEND